MAAAQHLPAQVLHLQLSMKLRCCNAGPSLHLSCLMGGGHEPPSAAPLGSLPLSLSCGFASVLRCKGFLASPKIPSLVTTPSAKASQSLKQWDMVVSREATQNQ